MNNQKYNQTTWRKTGTEVRILEKAGSEIFINKGNLAQERAEETPRGKVTNRNKGKSLI